MLVLMPPGCTLVAETPQFNGRVIEALARDPNLAKKNGQTLVTAELAVEYGIQDEGGRQPFASRQPHKKYP